jgi:sulfide:quinone oxidoreductase
MLRKSEITSTTEASPCADLSNPARREWLRMAAATQVVGGALTLTPPAVQAAKVSTKAHIVIAGSGLGGIAIANRLSAMLDGARITIIDRKEEHNYQPGYTLVATGVWPVEKVIERNADFHPSGVQWVKDMVASFDPISNTVVTTGGQSIRYDFLVVATGTHQDWDKIAGMDLKAIGTHGLASVYPSAQAAQATWTALQLFANRGGQAIMTLPATPLKCAGAPLKMTFMLRDRLHRAGKLSQSNIIFQSATGNVFGVKAVNDNVLARWQNLGIDVAYKHVLKAVDIGGQRATFANEDGSTFEAPYDFLHVVPPMRAPDAVKNSDLAWRDGPMSKGGWLEVDKKTLQHQRFPNVFGIGDINGTPRGKTAATIKKSAPIVAHNLVQLIAGRPLDEVFDGYTSCPLITREGSAMLVEFDYDGKLTPTLPVIDPLQDSFMAWMLKVRLLKPAYLGVLKGNV